MHTRSARIAVAVLLGCLLALVARPAAADDPQVEMTVEATASAVTLHGRLTLAGAPVADREVVGLVDGVEVGRSRSGADGAYRLEAAAQLTPGAHKAYLQVEGSGTIATSDFTISTPVELTASGPGEAVNGEVVTISGRLTSGGVGLTGAGVSLQDPSGDVADSYTVTGDDGSFQTMYLVPEEQAEGDLAVTLSFAGQGNYPAASTSVALPVTHLEVQASASEQPVAPTSATPSESAEIHPPTGEAGSTATGLPDSMPTGSATSQTQPAMSWFVVTVLVLAGLAVIAMVAIVIRAMTGRRHAIRDTESNSLDFLDADEEPSDDDTVAELFDHPEAERPSPASPDDGAREAPQRPRRGISPQQ